MMWETLRIPPTTDAAVIRRAYVAVLRGIDIDREPAAFMRLREAYEYALAACSFQETPGVVFALAPAAAPAAVYLEGNGRAAVDAEPDPYVVIESLLAHEGVGDAWRAYNGFMASGAIGLNDQRPLAGMVVTAALHDADLAIDTFRTMVDLLGPEDIVPDDLTVLRRDAAARIAAHRWLDRVTRDATRSPFGTRWSAVLAARSFLGRRRRLGRSWSKLEAIRRLLEEYSEHAKWLTSRVDEKRLANFKDRAALALKRKHRRNNIFVVAVLLFVVLNVLYQLLFGE